MSYESLLNFELVGGTALALHLGHRISIDLDFFSEQDFETEGIVQEMRGDLDYQLVIQKRKNSLITNARKRNSDSDYVKLDFLKYPYPLINEVQKIDGIRMLSIEDIIPMKLSAMANRGSKKDFFDIFELMKDYSISNMLTLFSKKYPEIAHFHILKSLTYFDDAELEPDPISLNGSNWDHVKATIEIKVRKYL